MSQLPSDADSPAAAPAPGAAYPAAHLARTYTRVRDETTPADQALLMLLEGAARFVHEGLAHLERTEVEEKHTALMKAQKIVTVLSNCLDRSIGEEPFQNIQSLYFYIYRKLSEGNVQDDADALREALTVLEDVTKMWRETVGAFHRESGAKPAPAAASAPAPGQGICLQG